MQLIKEIMGFPTFGIFPWKAEVGSREVKKCSTKKSKFLIPEIGKQKSGSQKSESGKIAKSTKLSYIFDS